MDLVQIRWQQIRSAEAIQLVESENISLKKLVASLRDKIALLAHEASQADLERKQAALLIADKDRRGSINLTGIEGVNFLLSNLRSDMTQLKLQWAEQLSWLSSQSNLLRESCRSFQSHLSVAQKEVEKVEIEKDSIMSELEFTKQAALLATVSVHEKIATLEERITRSDGDLRDAKGRNTILLTELEEKEAQAEVHVHEKLVIEHEKEELRRAMDIMQRRMDQLTTDNNIAVADLNDRTHLLRMNYEKIIEELSDENEQLRKICTEQEGRITMITSSLLGKKSNFTRYVEVKAENLTLQSKLDLLESQRVSAAGARLNRPVAASVLVEMEHILPAHQRKAKALIAAVEELHSERSFPINCDSTNRRHVPVKAESITVDKLDAQSIDEVVSMTSYDKELSPRKHPRIIFPPKEIIVSQSSIRFSDSPDTDDSFVERVLRVSKRSAPEVSPRSNSTPLNNSIGFESRQRQQQTSSSFPKANSVQVPKPLSSVRIEGVAAPTGLINSVSHPTHRIASEVLKLNQKLASDERLSGTSGSQSHFPPKSDKTLPSTGDVSISDDHIVLFPSIAKKDRPELTYAMRTRVSAFVKPWLFLMSISECMRLSHCFRSTAVILPSFLIARETSGSSSDKVTGKVSRVLCMSSRGFGTSSAPKFSYTGRVKAGKLSPTSKVPDSIMKPDYALDGVPKVKKNNIAWLIPPCPADDIPRMRVAGRIAREVLDEAVRLVRPGIRTDEIDKVVHEATIKRNSYPSPLNYHGFPKSCCTSVNEIICHGIPDSSVLVEGDIVNIDVTVFHDGVHGDCSETVFVGAVDDRVRDLVVTTFDCWMAAIAYCRPGRSYSDIGGIIEDIIAPKGYSTVKEFCGHGVGRVFHQYPNVLHYRNAQRSGVMEVGHTFTIEPMICMKSNSPVMWPDKWTAATSDGLPSAQFEHTLLMTEQGVEVLTAKLPTSPKYSWEQ